MACKPIRLLGLAILAACAFSGEPVTGAPRTSQDVERAPTVREITITARRYTFTPARIEVTRGDIVRITLVAEDVAHSFTIDEYRISKRVSPGRSVIIEFRADRAGRFVFYCSLTADDRCREMRGELIVQ